MVNAATTTTAIHHAKVDKHATVVVFFYLFYLINAALCLIIPTPTLNTINLTFNL